MKRIKWEQCGGSGASGDQNPLEFQNGMHVAAKYAGLYVHLRIIDLVDPHNFVAEVLFFEPASAKKPDDLRQGDQVNIKSGDICWTFDD